jgi:hypothetical protein
MDDAKRREKREPAEGIGVMAHQAETPIGESGHSTLLSDNHMNKASMTPRTHIDIHLVHPTQQQQQYTMQQIFEEYPAHQALVLNGVRSLLWVQEREEELVMVVLWLMLTAPAVEWKCEKMLMSMLDRHYSEVFYKLVTPVVLEEMGILFNNVDVMRFMWDAVHNCPEGCVTVFYWDKELQDLIEFEFVCLAR